MTAPSQNGRHARTVYFSPARIRDPWLPDAPWGRRGYAKEDVRRLLSAVAEQVESMDADLTAVRQTLHYREMEIEQRRYGVGLPAGGDARVNDEMLLRWQVETQRYSDDITSMAQRQAAEIVGEAQTQADQVRAEIGADLQATAEIASLRRTVATLRQCLYNVRRYLDTTDQALRSDFAGYSLDDSDSPAVRPGA
jgi:cell division septum initiation protein DivIVA